MKRADRICCDGGCCQGRDCPLMANQRRPAAQQRLAPGVIDGPHRRAALRTRVARALANLLLRSRRQA